MFLELRTTKITVPKSNEVSLVFPFNQCSCKFDRNKFDPRLIDDTKFTKQQLNDFIDKVESNCGNHKELRKYTILAIFSTIALVVCIIVGNIILNIGISRSSGNSVVEFTKFSKNGLVISGACVLFSGVAQFIILVFLLAARVRTLRLFYENIASEAVKRSNLDWKAREVRWKVGRYYNWLELSLDYKINQMLAKPSAFSPMILNKSGLKVKEVKEAPPQNIV